MPASSREGTAPPTRLHTQPFEKREIIAGKPHAPLKAGGGKSKPAVDHVNVHPLVSSRADRQRALKKVRHRPAAQSRPDLIARVS
jgi:hypothetical protein